MALIRVNGVELAYEIEGSGSPVVLVHGSWSDRHGWDQVADSFARDFTVVRYDRRGHSESERAPGTTRDDVRDLASLIEALDVAPAHVVGSSFGGIIAFQLAASSPELLRSLVSHEPPVTSLVPADHPARRAIDEATEGEKAVSAQIDSGDHEGAARRFVDEIAFGPGTWERLPDPLRATMVRNAVTFAEEQRDSEARWVDLEALRPFDRPVLLTQGTVGPEWFDAVIALIAEVLPKASRDVYGGAGHMPQGTHPDEYVELVSGFLRQADKG
ncbi:MAG: alpha/beta fold hydrolase [Actinomycetota bacterium]